MVAAMSPIWATNDKEYKNVVFLSNDQERYVGLSAVILNYEEMDINQCSGDRTLNAFRSTALCDSTTECLPLPMYGLNPGGYECECVAGFHYPNSVQGPYSGNGLINLDINSYPLCQQSLGLLQFPSWNSKNAFEFAIPQIGTSSNDDLYNHYLKKRNAEPTIDKEENTKKNIHKHRNFKKLKHSNNHKSEHSTKSSHKHRRKRFLDKRNNFEKLRDSIFGDQNVFKRRCLSMPYTDVLLLNDDDDRFVSNLRFHADSVFKAQTAQAIRIAHILSSYLQLHSPFEGASSVNAQNDYGAYTNMGINMTPDPQLGENLVVGEIMSTLQAHYPLQEVSVFFNGSEFERQKMFSTQDNLAFGLSMIRTDTEHYLNRSNDDTHLSKSWYKDASFRFRYGGGKSVYGGTYHSNEEKVYYQATSPFDTEDSFKFERYGIEMNLRRSFDGLHGNADLPVKHYDASSKGVWYGPYYNCQQKRFLRSKTTLRMTYSVPIITSLTKLPV
jgi:hypothetical protein